LPKYVWWLH